MPGNYKDGAMSNDEPEATAVEESPETEEGVTADDEDLEWPQLQPFELDVILATAIPREA